MILKRIRKFNLNFHITHTFPHHVDISFSEVGMSDVIDVLHCGRGRNLTVRDAFCPYLLLNAFEGEQCVSIQFMSVIISHCMLNHKVMAGACRFGGVEQPFGVADNVAH